MSVIDIRKETMFETLSYVKDLDISLRVENLLKRYVQMSNKGILIKTGNHSLESDLASSLDTILSRHNISSNIVDLYNGKNPNRTLRSMNKLKDSLEKEIKEMEDERSKFKYIERELVKFNDTVGNVPDSEKSFVMNLVSSNTSYFENRKSCLKNNINVLTSMQKNVMKMEESIADYEETMALLIIKKYFSIMEDYLQRALENHKLYIVFKPKEIYKSMFRFMYSREGGKFEYYDDKSFSSFERRLLGFLFNHLKSYYFEIVIPTTDSHIKLRCQESLIYLDLTTFDLKAKKELELVGKELSQIYKENDGLSYLLNTLNFILQKQPVLREEIRVDFWYRVYTAFPNLDKDNFVTLIKKQNELYHSYKTVVYTDKMPIIKEKINIDFVEKVVQNNTYQMFEKLMPQYLDENMKETETLLVGIQNKNYVFKLQD